MKNKTKLMLALSILTAGTLAAGATGTFAWFTTNKTATANISNVIVRGTQGNLNISMEAVVGKATIDNTAKTSATAAGTTTYMTDVSSKDGLTYAQPTWKSSANNSDAEYWNIKNVTDPTKYVGYYTEYTVTITNTAEATDSSDTSVALNLQSISITDNNEKAKNFVRVAINTSVSTDEGYIKAGNENITKVYQNSTANDSDKKYVAPADGAGKISEALENATVQQASNKITDFKITDLAATKSITLGISIWFEGTMADDQDAAKGSTVSIAMTFGDGAAK